MTKDEIIRMAREVLEERDGEDYYDYTHKIIHWWGKEDAIVKFAALVAAAEREACAKVCDAECNPTPNEGHITTYQSGGYIMAEYLASAIRARGQS